MGATGCPPPKYQLLVQGFREDPGNITHAARTAQVSRPTAKRAWETGWPKRQQPSIKRLMEDEVVAARAALADERAKARQQQEQEREKARQEAIDALREEGVLCNLARGTAIANLAGMADIGDGIRQLATALNDFLKTVKKISSMREASQGTHLLWKYAMTLRLLIEAGSHGMDMERKRLGKPEDILSVEDLEKAEITPEELEAELERSHRALDSLKERFVVIQGGAGKG